MILFLEIRLLTPRSKILDNNNLLKLYIYLISMRILNKSEKNSLR